MTKRTRNLVLVAVLLLVGLVLAGCALPQEVVDLDNPTGPWERFVVYPIVKVLIFLNDSLEKLGIGYSWGWAIILFTIFIKVITIPLNRKQLQSTKATQELQPRLKELQQKYGKDRQKLSEEQMKLYKEAGVNPMGGCLPMLIQMPILFGLYQALYVLASPSIDQLAGAPFYWIPDLAFPSLAVGTKWIGESFQNRDWYILFAYASLPILMIITSVAQQKMAQAPKAPKGGSADGQQQMMGQMMMFMPVMFGYITLGLPSGLTLYWTVSNILSMVQQYFVSGWGALVDWIPALRPKPMPVEVGVAASPGPEVVPEKPVKRRRRRK